MNTTHPAIIYWLFTNQPGERVVYTGGDVPRVATIRAYNDALRTPAALCFDDGTVQSGGWSRSIAPVIRASFRPAAYCPAAWREARHVPNVGSAATAEGTVAHEIDELVPARPNGLTHEDLAGIALRHRVAASTAREIEAMVRRYRARVADAEEAWGWQTRREVSLLCRLPSGVFIAARLDILAFSPTGDEAAIEDLKSGYGTVETPEHNWQALAYTACVFQAFPAIQRVSFRFALLRSRDEEADGKAVVFERASFERDVIPQMDAAALAAVGPKAPYLTGPHCAACPARGGCVALRRAVGGIVDFNPASAIPDLTPEERAQLARQLLTTEAWAKAVREAFDDYLRRADGEAIDLGDGRIMAMVEGAPRRTYDLSTLVDVRTCNLGEATADENDVPWGEYLRIRGEATERDLLEALKVAARRRLGVKRLPKGEGERLADSLRNAARSVGALTEEPTRTLRVTAKPSINRDTPAAASDAA